LNSLDLGAWYSLAAGVPSLKAVPGQKARTIDRIIAHVLERWDTWNAMLKLENIFSTKQRIFQAVLSCNGSNQYQIPRSMTSHKYDGPSYIPKPPSVNMENLLKTPPLVLDLENEQSDWEFEDVGNIEDSEVLDGERMGTPPIIIEFENEENDVLAYWKRRLTIIQ
jgi:hypothetical protein